jgi:hypothetical protein
MKEVDDRLTSIFKHLDKVGADAKANADRLQKDADLERAKIEKDAARMNISLASMALPSTASLGKMFRELAHDQDEYARDQEIVANAKAKGLLPSFLQV